MTPQQQQEVSFWKNEAVKGEAFIEQRKADYQDHLAHLPGLKEAKGSILEVGSGLLSVFEFSNKNVTSVDPLVDEYNKILALPDSKIDYKRIDDEVLPFEDESFNHVVCVNVIDHTPNHEKLAEEMVRVLKPKGKLFFEVNFDSNLSPAHYRIFNYPYTMSLFEGLDCIYSESEDRPEHHQTRFWAIFQKI